METDEHGARFGHIRVKPWHARVTMQPRHRRRDRTVSSCRSPAHFPPCSCCSRTTHTPATMLMPSARPRCWCANQRRSQTRLSIRAVTYSAASSWRPAATDAVVIVNDSFIAQIKMISGESISAT